MLAEYKWSSSYLIAVIFLCYPVDALHIKLNEGAGESLSSMGFCSRQERSEW